MKRSIIIFILISFCSNPLSAQIRKLEVPTGTWNFTEYSPNIIKLKFTPKDYAVFENITHAVNAAVIDANTIPVTIKEDALLIGNMGNVIIKSTFFKEGFNGFNIQLHTNEKIYGGGERALPLNRRGYKFNLYNNPWYGYSNGADNLNFSVPFFTSSNGYAVFFDNASKGYADIGKTNSNNFEVGFVSGELNMFVIFGKNYKEILASYFKLTGTQPLPPKWAMGNLMSRFGYTSEQQLTQIASKMKEEKIPYNAVIFDLFWFGDSIKGTLGNLDWINKTKWPDPKKMLVGFKKNNIQPILIAEPFILKGTKNYNNAKKYFAVDEAGKPFNLTDFYFGQGGLLDIFRKDAGNWIWNNHYKKQIANGVNAWWTDLGEPEKHPNSIRHNLKDEGVDRLMTADEVHNIYGHYWNKMLFENYAKEFPDQRLFHLNRSGFAGSQRYSIFPWSGDVSRSWSGLQAQLPVMLGMSMSGIPYIHADAGGFAGGEGDAELYTRWLQFAAFTPIFRPHGTALYEVEKAAFSFPSEPALMEEPYKSYARQTVNLRYSLLPYNYNLTYRQTKNAEPLVAPLYYHYPTNTTVANVEDEFMWGENILVAPVLQKGMMQRKIILPAGNWYQFNGDNIVYKDSVVEALSIQSIPVFIKSGSFIPSLQSLSSKGFNQSLQLNKLKIDYYFDNKPSAYTLYDDDGNNKNAIAKGEYELISFAAIPAAEKLTITVKSNNGNYSGKPVVRKLLMVINGREKFGKLYVNGKLKSLQTNGVKQQFNLNFTGKTITIELK